MQKTTATKADVKTFPSEHVFKFRKPLCPYCGGNLTASVNCYEQEADGSWIASELQIDCDSEPDIDGREWEGWWQAHSYDFCEGWSTLSDGILLWMKRHARFDIESPK